MDADPAPDHVLGPERVIGKPVGRRIFLGLLGLGAAGLVYERWALRGDDVSNSDVATEVALPPGTLPIQIESGEGIHRNPTFTERFRYYSVGDIPDFDESSWRLRVDGAGVDGRLDLRYAQLKAFPNYAETATFRCVTGWRVPDNIWRGVRVRDVVDAARPNAKAKYITFYSMDGVYTESLSWEQARSSHALLVWELGGEPLIREQGYPLRLIFPDMYGYKNIKWLDHIEVKDTRDLGFWEAKDGWEIDGFVYNPDQFRVDPATG